MHRSKEIGRDAAKGQRMERTCCFREMLTQIEPRFMLHSKRQILFQDAVFCHYIRFKLYFQCFFRIFHGLFTIFSKRREWPWKRELSQSHSLSFFLRPEASDILRPRAVGGGSLFSLTSNFVNHNYDSGFAAFTAHSNSLR